MNSIKNTVRPMNSSKNKLTKIIFAKHTLRVCFEFVYFAEIEIFFAESTVDKSKS